MIGRLRRDERGAALAEFALVLPLMLLLTFGIIEMAFLGWQVQQGAMASKRAVRVAATRDLVSHDANGVYPIADCGPGTSGTAGTPCAAINSSTAIWATCPGDNVCGADIDRILQEIADFYPRATAANVKIELSGAGLGFQGMGRPVPMVTVRFENVPFQWIVLGRLTNLGDSIVMPPLSASAPAEDLANGPGSSEFYR